MSTVRVDSSTSGPLISRPSCAPRPVPTIRAVGVARPSAHGQAMISTATAAVNANDAALAGAEPEAERGDRERDDHRHEDRRDAVGEPLHRRLAGLRVGHQPGDLGERGVLADARRADDQPPAGVDRRARDRARRDRPRPAPTRRSAATCRAPSCPPRRRRRSPPSRRAERRSGRRRAAARPAPGARRRRRRAARRPWRPARAAPSGPRRRAASRAPRSSGRRGRTSSRPPRPRGRCGRRRRPPRGRSRSSSSCRSSRPRRGTARRATTARPTSVPSEISVSIVAAP